MCIITALIKAVETGEVTQEEFVQDMGYRGYTAREACIMLGRDLSPELPPVIWVHFATGDFG